MLSLVVSTVAFLVATFLVRRSLDDAGVPRTAGRAVVVFLIAIAAAYMVAAAVDWIADWFS